MNCILENIILELVKDGVSSLTKLIHSVREMDKSYSESKIRQITWSLIDQGKLDLNNNREIVINLSKVI